MREVLFTTLSVGLKSAVVFLDGDVSFHVFIQDESQPRNLASAELKLEVVKHRFEFFNWDALRHLSITNSEEGLRSQSFLLKTLF